MVMHMNNFIYTRNHVELHYPYNREYCPSDIFYTEVRFPIIGLIYNKPQCIWVIQGNVDKIFLK